MLVTHMPSICKVQNEILNGSEYTKLICLHSGHILKKFFFTNFYMHLFFKSSHINQEQKPLTQTGV